MWEKIIDFIRVSSQNPLALIVGIGGLILFGFYLIKIRRLQLLINKISEFPEKQRIEIIREVLGNTKLKEGISSKQYLETKRMHYGFLAFCGILITIIILLTAYFYYHSLSNNNNKENPTPGVTQKIVTNKQLIDTIPFIRPGISRDYVVSLLGLPHANQVHNNGNNQLEDLYEFKSAIIQLFYENSVLVGISVTSKEKNFTPRIPLFFADKQLFLGKSTFSEMESDPHLFNMSSKDYSYTEFFHSSNATNNCHFVFSYNGLGVEYVEMNHEISLGKFCEIKYEEKFDKYFTKQEILTFQNFRKTMIPNSFAMVKNSSWDWIENEIPLSYWTAMKLSSSIPN